MSTFTKINKVFSPKDSYWELNPQVAYIHPFSKLYKSDNGGKHSSSLMWACFFYCDADEDLNLLYRLDIKNREEAIKEYYPKIDFDDELLQECIEAYPFECMDSIERSLKAEKDVIVERAKLMTNTPRTLDHYMTYPDSGAYILDKGGKPIFVKGTAAQLDKMHGQTPKIYEQLDKVLDKFLRSKEESARVYGGRAETISEQGLL